MTSETLEPSGSGVLLFLAAGFSSGLVVACGVKGRVSEEFSAGGVNDADVEFVDEEKGGGSGVGSSDSDLM